MKKAIKTSLSVFLTAATLVGCGGKAGAGASVASEDYNYVYVDDPKTFDYTTTQRSSDTEVLVNFVDGLVENDSYGNYVGSLAKEIKHSDDYKTWTFKLREGAKWYTHEQEEYADVKAQDFVTGLRHALEAGSGTAFLVEGLIKNVVEFEKGKVPFEEVGIKAVDDHTVEYTLEKPATYFDSLASYTILYPVNQKFLESKGAGCKLGSFDANTCSFGATDPSSILYNGPYFLTNFTTKSKIEYTKNEHYWDKDNVHINKVNLVFDDGQDNHSVMKGFEQGNYVVASISGTWSKDEQEQYKKKYEGKVTYGMPDSSTYNLVFNFNRKSYKYTGHKTDEEKQATQEAIRNVNFRKALRAAFDRNAYATQRTGNTELANKMLRNTMTKGDFVAVNGDTFSMAVQKNLKDKESVKGDLNDGKDAFYNPEMAKKYLEAAKAEGVKFPVKLDLVAFSAGSLFVNQANSMKKSVEAATNGQILINVIEEKDQDKYTSITYTVEDAKDNDWDISNATGWGPDYLDPRSYLNIYSPVNGDMMKSLGINAKVSKFYNDSDAAAATALKLNDYQELLTSADNIHSDLNKRFEAYAKAEAWLTDNVLQIPIACLPVVYRVSKIKPFTGIYAPAGPSDKKFKRLIVTKEIVTADEYNKAKTEWMNKRLKK